MLQRLVTTRITGRTKYGSGRVRSENQRQPSRERAAFVSAAEGGRSAGKTPAMFLRAKERVIHNGSWTQGRMATRYGLQPSWA